MSKDIHDTPDSTHNPAPMMTPTQRVMLGFMARLEKDDFQIFHHFLTLAEQRLLTAKELVEVSPITRLYLAVCKLQKNFHRMRRLCCDFFYFCDDLAVPFLFMVLTSWPEILPNAADAENVPLARILVQVVYLKHCGDKPGFNLLPLRNLLVQFYKYPSERWDSDVLFEEFLNRYLSKFFCVCFIGVFNYFCSLGNPVRSSDYALLLFCKNHPDKWVNEKIDQHLKPLIDKIPNDNSKAAVIILIGNLSHRFSSKAEVNYVTGIRQWLRSLITSGK